MPSRFQQEMCLVYLAQYCLLLRTGKRGNLNLLFYYHNWLFWILSQNRCSYFKKKCSLNLAVVYPEGFQGRYTSLGTKSCIQLKKNSLEKLSLIQILRDKIFIAIVCNFMICFFLMLAIKTVFMLCFKQFILQILNCTLCPFYTSLLVLMFP